MICQSIVPAAEGDTKPNVAVVDIDLPGMDGLTTAAALHETLPDCRTLVLTGLSQPVQAHVRVDREGRAG